MRIAKAILFPIFFSIIFSTCSWSLGSCWECERRSLPHPRCAGTGQAGVHREDLQSIIVERSNRLSGTSRATNWQASQGKKHLLHGRRKISCSCVVFALKSRLKVSGLRLSWVTLCSFITSAYKCIPCWGNLTKCVGITRDEQPSNLEEEAIVPAPECHWKGDCCKILIRLQTLSLASWKRR